MTAIEALETHLSPTPAATLAPPPPVQISDDDLLATYGPTIWEALAAFGTDPGYAEDIVRAANNIDERRESWKVSARRRDLLATLGKKVEERGECWVWTAATNNKGVPQMKLPGSSRTLTARSWTVEQWHGPDPTRWMVQATCGDRLCVHPEHATWRSR